MIAVITSKWWIYLSPSRVQYESPCLFEIDRLVFWQKTARPCQFNKPVRGILLSGYALSNKGKYMIYVYVIYSCRYHNPRVPKWNVDQMSWKRKQCTANTNVHQSASHNTSVNSIAPFNLEAGTIYTHGWVIQAAQYRRALVLSTYFTLGLSPTPLSLHSATRAKYKLGWPKVSSLGSALLLFIVYWLHYRMGGDSELDMSIRLTCSK